MKIDAFDFDLPATAIAQHPVRPRDAARLLHVQPGVQPPWTDLGVRDLPGLLRPGDLMVVNDTRVLPTRLAGQRGAGRIEATLIARTGPGAWQALARPTRRLKVGDTILFAEELAARVAEKRPDGSIVLAFHASDAELMAALDRIGQMPLPPYIQRPRQTAEPNAEAPATNNTPQIDRDDYQTVFARAPGAVAAPTAGLHFTPALLAALDQAGIGRVALTLHVGAGTFQPVRATDTRDHVMHSEWGTVPADVANTINQTRARGGRILAVGTTSLRLLESAANADGTVSPFAGTTDIFILPGFRFRAVDLLMTNFHLPRSTLFMLVSAFSGLDLMKAAYSHAVATGYRFYSYGDGCLLHPAAPVQAPS